MCRVCVPQGCDPDAAALALLDPGATGGVDGRVLGRLLEELTGLTAVRGGVEGEREEP